ncbi:hypothetical protein [Arcobacter sp. CECT 8989]|uniref:hypothetical protein n=1 Tax=Arcobacter sp. CECT 8989 TaxID=2044509 RepID=UPI00100AF6A1|nr:hypothetical protein [Arcobacter sp. CECT 8989]
MSKFYNYLNQIKTPNLKYIEGWIHKKEYVKNTMDLYFENIANSDFNIFSKSELKELEYWLFDVSKKRRDLIYSNYPYNKHLESEAIKFNDSIILKECFNLLNFITNYHEAYIIRTKHEDDLKDTIFNVSFDKRKMNQRYKKFESISNNLRLNRKDKASYTLIKNILKLLTTKKYEKRAKFYIYTIALNFNVINWEKLISLNKIDDDVVNILFKTIDYFMYENYSENKIKHSSMIIVYTFLTKRMCLNENDSLDLTNRLCNDILYDLDSRKDYTKKELSQDIYVHSVFNYLPIFSHYNKKNKPIYTKQEEKKLAKTIQNKAISIDKKLKSYPIDEFINIFRNAHIDYIKLELMYLYSTKNEKS